MNPYMFDWTNDTLPAREVNRRDRICREEGGYGYTQLDKPAGGNTGWFTGPNLGEPFNSDLARRVRARL